ncbi:MAG: hypothetical protein IE891_03975 [Flavobacteriaceae bacterium]|nr:hypothetical protein [Flavobacteriaceae bacterium]
MNPLLRNILAVIVGAIIGSIVNGALISVSGKVIPPPDGADVTTFEGLKSSIHLFEPKHFIFPFLAHAIGTLIGALIAYKIAVGNKLRTAMIVGVLFLIGGISNCFLLPAPFWFMAVDVLFAYIPMAYLGCKLSGYK